MQSRITHYEDEDLKLEGEVVEGEYFVHLSFNKFNHTIQKKTNVLFVELTEAMKQAGYPERMYALLENKKYAEYMGGSFVKDIYKDDKVYGVYVWAV